MTDRYYKFDSVTREMIEIPLDDCSPNMIKLANFIAEVGRDNIERYLHAAADEFAMPDGEGFCPRCLMPLTQCNCKERKV